MVDISSRYTVIDSVGSGSATDPRHPADWYGQRLDLFCRAIRNQLFCLNPDGTPNDSVQATVRDFIRVTPYLWTPGGFVIVRLDIPTAMLDLVLAVARHPNEDSRDDQYVADDIDSFRIKCIAHNILVRRWLNNLNLGWTLGTTTPLQDVVTAMNSFTAGSLGTAINRALRLRYSARLAGQSTAGFPDVLGGETINAPVCAAYANALDALASTHPANLIHILYELAASEAAVVALS